ncbi:DUF998 domain-containing protein [Nocardia blacklockiae]|nr:DUF998 domain-containing protein [Nocardia blacklockiae]
MRRLRHTVAGIAWTLALGYLVVEFVTAIAWKRDYSFRHDTISDLGITACTPNLCSPLHLLMNAAFVALGLLTIIGAIGFRHYIPHGRRQWSIVALAVIIGASTAATGVFPSNDGIIIHGLAVLPALISRHVVLILLAIWLWKHRRLAALWSAVCASTGLTGTVLFTIGLQVGITERLLFYPLPVWMAVTGAAIVLTPLRSAISGRIRIPLGSPAARISGWHRHDGGRPMHRPVLGREPITAGQAGAVEVLSSHGRPVRVDAPAGVCGARIPRNGGLTHPRPSNTEPLLRLNVEAPTPTPGPKSKTTCSPSCAAERETGKRWEQGVHVGHRAPVIPMNSRGLGATIRAPSRIIFSPANAAKDFFDQVSSRRWRLSCASTTAPSRIAKLVSHNHTRTITAAASEP